MSVDNRANLIEQAMRLFAARGYDAVAVQEIVEAAGVTKPTLYHYFGSKGGLLEAIIDCHHPALLTSVESAAKHHGDLVQNLREVVKTYFDHARHHPIFHQMTQSMRHAPPQSEAYQAVRSSSEAEIAVLRQLYEGSLPHMAERAHRYAVTLRGMINTYIRLALQGDVDLNEQLVLESVHQYMHGIYS